MRTNFTVKVPNKPAIQTLNPVVPEDMPVEMSNEGTPKGTVDVTFNKDPNQRFNFKLEELYKVTIFFLQQEAPVGPAPVR